MSGFASNGFGDHSPGGYSMMAALVTEIVMTMMFLLVILGATDKRAARYGARSDWALPYLDPPGQHSCDQHIGESCTQYGRCTVCG